MLSSIFAAALAATLTCDPSVFRAYVYPQGAVTNNVLDPRGVPGATPKAEAFSRIEANAATAMLGIRDGFIQRILWPVMNAECGGAKEFFQGKTNNLDLTSVDFASADEDEVFTCTSKNWLRPWYAKTESFRNDIIASSNRVYSSPRIVETARNACGNIISRYLKGVAATPTGYDFNTRGYWLVPGIDHMSLCNEGTAEGDAGSLIDFDSGAFLPLLRCVDDVADPSNTDRASNNGFYGDASNFRPALMFSAFTAGDSNPNAELGASCSSTNLYTDIRIGPKMSDLLCAAAPGLPHDATSLSAIANAADNPRVLWHRFALANAILGTMTDFFVPRAQIYNNIGYSENYLWNTRECELDGLNRVFNYTFGIDQCETYNAEGFQEWTCQGTSSEDSPIVIAQVYDESSDSYHWGAKIDIDKFKAGAVKTNIYESSYTTTQNLEGVTFGWEDSENGLGASLVVTFEGTYPVLNDTAQDDGTLFSSANLEGVPTGTYPPECFEIEDDRDEILNPHGMSEGLVVKWSQTSDLVPADLRGKILQRLSQLPNGNASAKISANRYVMSSGSFRRRWMSDASPYEEPEDIKNARRYNYRPVGMFPEGSALSQYVDFTLLSIIKAAAYTNNMSYIRDHGTNIFKTAVIKTRLKKHNIVPTTTNLRSAQVNDRKEAIELMNAASSSILKWNINDHGYRASDTDAYAMKRGVDVSNFASDTKELFTSNSVAPLIDIVMGDGNGNGGMVLNVTSYDGRKVGWWTSAKLDVPMFQLRFALSGGKDYPKRFTARTMFKIDHHLYMKFKFPMFDCSGAAWPGWTPKKEYEPKRPYEWEDEENDDSSTPSTSKDILE